MKKKTKRLIRLLEDIGNEIVIPARPMFGLCFFIKKIDRSSIERCTRLMAEWPEGTGSIDYPVPHPEMDSREAYEDAYVIDMYQGQYGQNRRDLALYLAEELEKLS